MPLARPCSRNRAPPPDAVRLRAQIAMDYISDSNLKQAAVLLQEAEKLVQFDFKKWTAVAAHPIG